jgi:AcrR family transcriptional regulator
MTAKILEAPRIDPRVSRTRALIREALKSMCGEKAFESITVADIAERATVNRAKFYAHFQDKFALLESVLREGLREHLAQTDPLEADTRSLLLAVGTNVFGFVSEHRNCKVDRDFEPELARAMEAEIVEFLEPRFSRCIAHLIGTAMVGSAMRWRADRVQQSAERIVREIVDALCDGVAGASR